MHQEFDESVRIEGIVYEVPALEQGNTRFMLLSGLIHFSFILAGVALVQISYAQINAHKTYTISFNRAVLPVIQFNRRVEI
jgi:hypothetical protein